MFIGSMAPLSQSHIWIARQPFVYWEKSPDECLKLDNLFSKNKFLTSDFSVCRLRTAVITGNRFFLTLTLWYENHVSATSKRLPLPGNAKENSITTGTRPFLFCVECCPTCVILQEII